MTDAPAQPEKFKAPITVGTQLKPGDRITCVVIRSDDENKSEKLMQIYNTDMIVIAYEPAPPAIEPKCEVEVNLGEGQEPVIGTVIAVTLDHAWIEARLGGHAVYPKDIISVIRVPKK